MFLLRVVVAPLLTTRNIAQVFYYLTLINVFFLVLEIEIKRGIIAVLKNKQFEISSQDNNSSFTISFPRKTGVYLGTFFLIFLLFLIGSLIHVIKQSKNISKAKNILSENILLRDQLFSLSTEIDSIRLKLRQMEIWEDEIRAERNLKAIDKEIRNMGIGGNPIIDSTFSYLGEDFNASFNSIVSQINNLKSKVNFDHKTYKDLVEQLELKELLYLNTPSIYPAYGRISDAYGWRKHPITGNKSFHKGIDFSNKKGTPIYATADGIVTRSSRERYFGRYITLKHKFGYQTKYAHLNRSFVAVGQEVKKGEIIGLMGDSGRSTGDHLHYEVIRYNKHRNPYKYLNKSKSEIILAKK